MLKLALASLLLATAAHADLYPGKVYQSELFQFDVDQKATSLPQPDQGTVTVDFDRNEVTLILSQSFHCPEGNLCAQVVPAPWIRKLPIIEMKEDECGKKVIIAGRDMRPADGIFERITLIDSLASICPGFVDGTTRIEYETKFFSPMTSEQLETKSVFTGYELVEQPHTL